MTRIRSFFALAFLAAVGSTPLAAQERSWTVCGGSSFATCASVNVLVTGQSVTMRVWNLSGFYGTYANTILNVIGFTDVGTAVGVAGSLTMSGPVRAGNTPQAWTLRNDVTTRNGIFLDIIAGAGGIDNAIGDACATQIPTELNLWENPCRLPTGPNDPGWVVINFDITGTWDLTNTWANIHGFDPVRNRDTDCITGGPGMNCRSPTVPEPITVTLLGTGLAGLGGFGLMRRRRRRDHDIVS